MVTPELIIPKYVGLKHSMNGGCKTVCTRTRSSGLGDVRVRGEPSANRRTDLLLEDRESAV